MNIYQITKQMMDEQGGIVLTSQIVERIKSKNPHILKFRSTQGLAQIIARELRKHGLRPKNIRVGHGQAKGYSVGLENLF